MFQLKKRIIIIYIIAGVISGFIFFILYYYKPINLYKRFNTLHYYEVEDFKINKIKLLVFYFVPNDQIVDKNWKDLISQTLDEVKKFHQLEFKGLSLLDYNIYPRPILALNNSSFYDGSNTTGGNPNALNNSLKEINERVFRRNSDFYFEDFFQKDKEEFIIKVIIYEGVGAAGGHFAIILAKDFLKTPEGSTILYHEFLHTLGVPDFYDYETNLPYSDDIMGSGRRKKINETYIREEIKEKLGARF